MHFLNILILPVSSNSLKALIFCIKLFYIHHFNILQQKLFICGGI